MSVGRLQVFSITGTSPAAASTAAVGNPAQSLLDYDWFSINATIIGGTGGTIDACLQYKIDSAGTDEWWDWVRFPQVAAATTTKFVVEPQAPNTITTVGSCTTASPAMTVAANTNVGGHPGFAVRLVVTAGAGTSAGATQTVKIRCWRGRK